jgi:hypothetical protein
MVTAALYLVTTNGVDRALAFVIAAAVIAGAVAYWRDTPNH